MMRLNWTRFAVVFIYSLHVLIYVAGFVYVEAFAEEEMVDFAVQHHVRILIYVKFLIFVLLSLLCCCDNHSKMAATFHCFIFFIDICLSLAVLVLYLIDRCGSLHQTYTLIYFLVQNIAILFVDFLGMLSTILGYQHTKKGKNLQEIQTPDTSANIRLENYEPFIQNGERRTRSNRNVVLKLASPQTSKLEKVRSSPVKDLTDSTPKKFDVPSINSSYISFSFAENNEKENAVNNFNAGNNSVNDNSVYYNNVEGNNFNQNFNNLDNNEAVDKSNKDENQNNVAKESSNIDKEFKNSDDNKPFSVNNINSLLAPSPNESSDDDNSFVSFSSSSSELMENRDNQTGVANQSYEHDYFDLPPNNANEIRTKIDVSQESFL